MLRCLQGREVGWNPSMDKVSVFQGVVSIVRYGIGLPLLGLSLGMLGGLVFAYIIQLPSLTLLLQVVEMSLLAVLTLNAAQMEGQRRDAEERAFGNRPGMSLATMSLIIPRVSFPLAVLAGTWAVLLW